MPGELIDMANPLSRVATTVIIGQEMRGLKPLVGWLGSVHNQANDFMAQASWTKAR